MVEQYIYSRSNAQFTNSRGQEIRLGYGYVAYSPGMDAAMKREAQLHCEVCPQIEIWDKRGCRLPLFRKVCLPSGRILFQKSTRIEQEERPFHVAHGYLAAADDGSFLLPLNWFKPEYRLNDPNQTKGGILLDSLSKLEGNGEFIPPFLSEAMQGIGLDRQHFFQMLLACFEAFCSRRQVLIACDFRADNILEVLDTVLFWLFSCLPYAMRRKMGFDSTYTEISSPEYIQLAFVDRDAITLGEKIRVQAGGQSVPLRGNILVADNRILHDSNYATVWLKDEPTCLFSYWLEEVTSLLWECSDFKQELILCGRLHETYGALDAELNKLSAEERFTPKSYSAVCESLLEQMPREFPAVRDEVRTFFQLQEQLQETPDKTQEGLEHDGARTSGGGTVPLPDLSSPSTIKQVLAHMPPSDTVSLTESEMAQLCDFADRCQLRADEVGLNALETLQRVFSPHRKQKPLRSCWHTLFAKQQEAIVKRDPPFPDFARENGRFTQRIRALRDGLPDDFPEGRAWLTSVLESEYRTLLQSPPSFMDAAWLHQELQGLLPHTDAEQTLQLLDEFTKQTQKNLSKWEAYRKEAKFSDKAWRDALQAARGMFLAGTLPGINAAFLRFCLYKQPEKGREILTQAIKQDGGFLLLDAIRKAADYRNKKVEKRVINGIAEPLFLIRMVSSDPAILNQANQGETPDFDDRFLDLLLELKKQGAIAPNEADAAMQKVREHRWMAFGEKPKPTHKKIVGIFGRR